MRTTHCFLRVAAPRYATRALLALAFSAAASPFPSAAHAQAEKQAQQDATPLYRDITLESGVDFVHANGATGMKQGQEQMGSGACLLDYDGDGRLDVYLVTSVGTNRLYRNLGGLRFRDATESSGIGDRGYGMGAVAADIDNDGDPDVLVTNFGPNRLYLNQGNGRFRDVSEKSGVADSRWGTSAVSFDYDKDGWLDLYVANYAQIAVPDTNVCFADGGKLRLHCSARRYPGEQHLFYRNRGDGTFENVTEKCGVGRLRGRGMGVVATDYDHDGWIDVYVANDLHPNFLFRNLRNGTFEEVGLVAGCSHSEDGVELSGMGVAAGDYDNDGWIDLFVTNYVNETNTLYHNEGGGFFLDASASARLGPMSLPYVGWGTKFFDFDLDGYRDLFVANGHTEPDAEKVDPSTSWRQRQFLFRNAGDGTFEDVTASVSPPLLEPRVARGTAFGDLDNDGDTEIVVVSQNDRALLLEHTGLPERHWIGFRTKGTKSNRDGAGSRIVVWSKGFRGAEEIQAGASYLSCNDPRVVFGLGASAQVDSVVVEWPSGLREVRTGLMADRYHLLLEGDASP